MSLRLLTLTFLVNIVALTLANEPVVEETTESSRRNLLQVPAGGRFFGGPVVGGAVGSAAGFEFLPPMVVGSGVSKWNKTQPVVDHIAPQFGMGSGRYIYEPVAGTGEGKYLYIPPSSNFDFNLVLSSASEVPAVVTPKLLLGAARLHFNQHDGRLTYKITHNVTDATMIHIHRGAAGANGSVMKTIKVAAPAGTFLPKALYGSVKFNETEALQLMNGLTYINLHSAAFPAGVLRAQIPSSANSQAGTGSTGEHNLGIQFIPGTGADSHPFVVFGEGTKNSAAKYELGSGQHVSFVEGSGTGDHLFIPSSGSGSGGINFVPGSAAASGLDGRFYVSSSGDSGLGFEFVPSSGTGDDYFHFPALSKASTKTMPDMRNQGSGAEPMIFVPGSGSGVASAGAFFQPSTGSGASGQGFFFVPGSGASSGYGSAGHWFVNENSGSGSGIGHLGFEFVPESGTGSSAHLHFPAIRSGEKMQFPSLGSASVAPMQFMEGSGSGVSSGGVFFQPATGSGSSGEGFYFVPGTGSAGDLGHWFMPGSGTGDLGMPFQPESGTGSGAHLQFPHMASGMEWPDMGSSSGQAFFHKDSGSAGGYFFLPATGSGAESGQGFFFQQGSGTGEWFMGESTGSAQGNFGMNFNPASGTGEGAHLHFPEISQHGIETLATPAYPAEMINVKQNLYGSANAKPVQFFDGTGVGVAPNGYFYVPGGSGMDSKAAKGYFFVPDALGSGSAAAPQHGKGSYFFAPEDFNASGTAGGMPKFGAAFYPKLSVLQYGSGSGAQDNHGVGSGGMLGNFDISVTDFFAGSKGTVAPTPSPTPATAPIATPKSVRTCQPVLSSVGTYNKVVNRPSMFYLEVDASLATPNCAANVLNARYQWSVTPAVKLESTTTSTLKVKPYTLAAGMNYTFSVSVFVGNNPDSMSVLYYSVTVPRSALQLEIAGGMALSPFVANPLTLDASHVVDPDFNVMAVGEVAAIFRYNWTCMTSGGACDNVFLPKTAVLTIPANTLVAGKNYVFSVSVNTTSTDGMTRFVSATQSVAVLASTGPSVSISSEQLITSVNPFTAVRLTALLENNRAMIDSINWSVTSTPASAAASLMIEDSFAPAITLGAAKEYVNSVAGDSVFVAGAQYNFLVGVIQTGVPTMSARAVVSINEPPTNGVFSASVLGANTITLSTTQWFDAGSAEGVTYQFYRRSINNNMIPLNIASDALTLTADVPAGVYSVGVRAIDIMGLASHQEMEVTVGLGNLSNIDAVSDYLSAAQKEFAVIGDASAYINRLAAAATTLNTLISMNSVQVNANTVQSHREAIARHVDSLKMRVPASTIVAVVREILAESNDSVVAHVCIGIVSPLIAVIGEEAVAGDMTDVNALMAVVSTLLSVKQTDGVFSNLNGDLTLALLSATFELMGSSKFTNEVGDSASFAFSALSTVNIHSRVTSSTAKPVAIKASAATVSVTQGMFGSDAFDLSVSEYPVTTGAQLNNLNLFVQVTQAETRAPMEFLSGEKVTVSMAFACPQASCIPECVAWNVASKSWSTQGVTTGPRKNGVVQCQVRVASALVGVFESTNYATMVPAGATRVRMEIPFTEEVNDLSNFMQTTRTSFGIATNLPAVTFVMRSVSVSQFTGSLFVIFDIMQSQVKSEVLFFELRQQSSKEVSHLRSLEITRATHADSFTMFCNIVLGYRATCATTTAPVVDVVTEFVEPTPVLTAPVAEESSSTSAGIIVAAVLGSIAGVAALIGAAVLLRSRMNQSKGAELPKYNAMVEPVAPPSDATPVAAGNEFAV